MMQSLLKANKNKVMMVVVLIILSFGYAIQSNAQYSSVQSDAEVQDLIHKILLKKGLGAGGVLNDLEKVQFKDSAVMQSYYEARGNQPVWVKGKNTENIAEILTVLDEAWLHGLNPETYHASQIRKLLESTHLDKARLDLVVSDAIIRYGHDITGMRVKPSDVRQRIDYWRAPLGSEDVMTQVGGSNDPASKLKELAPKTVLYKKLQEELVRLTSEQNSYDHVLPLRFNGDHHFTPGKVSKDVIGLRVRLGLDKVEDNAARIYDDNTAAAVMSFQREHGLEPDGIIGPQTLAVLNRSNREHMEQVVANLERLRWLEQSRPDRYILVNIAQQLLWAVDNGKVEHEMKVVVGLPHRRTQEFKTEVTGVRFNPTWTVPLNLKMKDFLPKLQEDPGVLARKRIEVIEGVGRNAVSIDPESVDWNNISRSEMNQMRFVQSPGSHNALGSVRILMPNRYDIYMHDTNHPEYFEREQRTYSSGCIRLSEPEKIANFVLKDNEGWSQEKMDAIIAKGRLTEVNTEKPFPVYIIYQTIWLDEQGRLVYGADVYKRDRQLIEVLAKMDGYKLPTSDDTRFAKLGDGEQAALAYSR